MCVRLKESISFNRKLFLVVETVNSDEIVNISDNNRENSLQQPKNDGIQLNIVLRKSVLIKIAEIFLFL